MKPMSEAVDIDSNDSNVRLNSEVSEGAEDEVKSQICDNKEDDTKEENSEGNGDSSKPDAEITGEDLVENVEPKDSEEAQDSVQEVTNQSPTEEVESPSSVENKDRQSSVDEKSHPSLWSYSQWSENYESLEDERTVEDLNGDPKKLVLWAAEKNESETLRKLLEEDPGLVNARDNDLYTPLHRASYSNNVEVIKMLLSYEADLSSTTADGWQALHCACKWDSVEAVSLLLQNGANVNAQTKGHITPLHLAASNASGRRTLELLLWQPYIDPNVKNDAGDTAYDIACRTGPLGALFEILEESANVY